jgi:3-methyladenine DNA glycosylase AlkD
MFTFAHVRDSQFAETLRISNILLNDGHDLIHKAVGWMLREIGNRDVSVLRIFLEKNHKKMPRTMLRYAIEKLDPGERAKWMAK